MRGYGACADTNQRQESPEGLFRILFSYKIEEMAGRISSYDQYHLGNSCVEERRHGQVVDFDDYVDVKEGKKGKELSQKIVRQVWRLATVLRSFC